MRSKFWQTDFSLQTYCLQLTRTVLFFIYIESLLVYDAKVLPPNKLTPAHVRVITRNKLDGKLNFYKVCVYCYCCLCLKCR